MAAGTCWQMPNSSTPQLAKYIRAGLKAVSSLTQNQASTQLNLIRVPTKRTSNLSISVNRQSFKANLLSCDSCVGYLYRTNKLSSWRLLCLVMSPIKYPIKSLLFSPSIFPHLRRYPKFPVPQALRKKKTPRAVWFVAFSGRRLKMEVCYHGILCQQPKKRRLLHLLPTFASKISILSLRLNG